MPSVDLKHLLVGLRCQVVTWAFNVQRRSWPKRGLGHSDVCKKLCCGVRSIRKLISSFLTVSFTQGLLEGNCDWAPQVQGSPWASSIWTVPLFLLLFSSVLPPYCELAVPSPVVACLRSVQESNAAPREVVFHLVSSFFCQCSLFNT